MGRVDDAGQIIRAERFDDLASDGLRSRHVLDHHGRRIVHHDEDDPPVLVLGVLAHIGGHDPNPGRGGRVLVDNVGEVDGAEAGDRLRFAVFEHREVIGAQAADGLPLSIEDRDVQHDQFDAALESGNGLRGGLSGRGTQRQNAEQQNEADDAAHADPPGDLAVAGAGSAIIVCMIAGIHLDWPAGIRAEAPVDRTRSVT